MLWSSRVRMSLWAAASRRRPLTPAVLHHQLTALCSCLAGIVILMMDTKLDSAFFTQTQQLLHPAVSLNSFFLAGIVILMMDTKLEPAVAKVGGSTHDRLLGIDRFLRMSWLDKQVCMPMWLRRYMMQGAPDMLHPEFSYWLG